MKITIDAQIYTVREGMMLAAVLPQTGDGCSRTSVSGQRRSPTCGMGICQECRVWVNGIQQLACQTPVAEGMTVDTYLKEPSHG